MFHFSEGHHYSHIRPLDLLATRGYLWVEFFFVLSGFILTHAYWPRLKDLFARPAIGLPARPADPALSPASVHAAAAAGAGGGLAGAGGARRLSLHLRRQVSPGCQRQGILAEPVSDAGLEHDEHPDLERRLLVRQRGIRALPAVSRFSLAGGRRAVARLRPDRRRACRPCWRCSSPPSTGWTSPITMACCAGFRISPSAWAWRCCSGG